MVQNLDAHYFSVHRPSHDNFSEVQTQDLTANKSKPKESKAKESKLGEEKSSTLFRTNELTKSNYKNKRRK